MEYVTLEDAQALIDFLQGYCPDNLSIQNMPTLNAQQAFAVLYYLQEQMELIPDTYEMCDSCHELYNADSEGFCVGDTHFCDNCTYLDFEDYEYFKYQFQWMICTGLSLDMLISELQSYKKTINKGISLPEIYDIWQKDRKNMWFMKDNDCWENHYFDLQKHENNALVGYEKYQLEWMQDHEYSLDNLIEELEKIRLSTNSYEKDGEQTNILDLFALWEKDYGFESQIWASKEEWMDTVELAQAPIPTPKDMTIDYLTILGEIHEALKEEYLHQDENNPNNILIYRKAGENCKEGWYSQNVFEVATELLDKEDSYKEFKNAIKNARAESTEDQSIKVSVKDGMLKATIATDSYNPGIDIEYISDNDNGTDLSRPRVLVENPECGNALRCLIWDNPQNEDFTKEISLKDSAQESETDEMLSLVKVINDAIQGGYLGELFEDK